MQRITRDLTRMRGVADVPERARGEPFRGYFARVATGWLAQHAHQDPDLAASLRRLLAREAKRHRSVHPPGPQAR